MAGTFVIEVRAWWVEIAVIGGALRVGLAMMCGRLTRDKQKTSVTCISLTNALLIRAMLMRDRLPPLNWLRTFEAAARHLSFTLAGQELGISQSAVSQQIKLLELELGETFFVRRPRALQLTDAGRRILPTIETAFNMIATGMGSLSGGIDADRRVDFHGNMAFTALWLTPRLPRFLEAFPWAVLNIATSVWTSEYVRPYASIEVRFGHGSWEGMRGDLLYQDTVFPVAAPGYPRSIHDGDLYDVAGIEQGWPEWLRAAGHEDWRNRRIHWASTFVVTLKAAERGAGLAMAHGLVCADELAAGSLVEIDGPRLKMTEGYYLIQPPGVALSEASKAFLTWMQHEMAEFNSVLAP